MGILCNMPKATEKPAPRMVYHVCETFFVEGHGYRPSIVVEGEDGHHPTGDDDWETNPAGRRPYFWGPTLADALESARVMNERMGISEKDAVVIVARSQVAGTKRNPRQTEKLKGDYPRKRGPKGPRT